MGMSFLIGGVAGIISIIIVGVFALIIDIDLSEKKNFFTCVLLSYFVLKFLLFIINDYFPISQTSKPTVKNLELITINKCRLDYGARGICGTIKNNSSHTYRYAEISINLYDYNGNLIGNTLSNINNFKPNRYWKFQAPVIEYNATSFEVEEISGF